MRRKEQDTCVGEYHSDDAADSPDQLPKSVVFSDVLYSLFDIDECGCSNGEPYVLTAWYSRSPILKGVRSSCY